MPALQTAPNPIDLTTVAYLQQYLSMSANSGGGGQPVSGNPALLQTLVTAASKTARTFIGRNPFVTNYNETYDGTGTQLLVLRNWPIISVSLVQVYGGCGWIWNGGGAYGTQPVFPTQPLVIPPSVNGQPGYIFDKNNGSIVLVGGYSFAFGSRNVNVVYIAGWTETFPEVSTVPNSGVLTVQNAATFVQDGGVVYGPTGSQAGTALTLVASSPAVGQYTVNALGQYGFNSADKGAAVIVTYTFGQPPYDLQDAVCEIAATEYRRTAHIDQDSQAFAEATTGYTRLAMPRLAQLRLENYKNKIPAM